MGSTAVAVDCDTGWAQYVVGAPDVNESNGDSLLSLNFAETIKMQSSIYCKFIGNHHSIC